MSNYAKNTLLLAYDVFIVSGSMIINTNQLSVEQLDDLERLSQACKQHDRLLPNIYTHILSQPRMFPACLLHYDQGKLIGFLSAYFFYDDAVEVSILVHPEARRKKIATTLLQAIMPLIQSQRYQTLIFSSPADLNSSWLIEKQFIYKHSEYSMERGDLQPILASKQALSCRTATRDDILYLCALDEACFPQKQSNIIQRFEHLFNGHDYQIILAMYKNQVIAKAHMRWQQQCVTLSDIAVMPQHQGQGFGSELIIHCINLALSEGIHVLDLDVETHNQKALNIYTRLGFVTKNACDYWSIALEQPVE